MVKNKIWGIKIKVVHDGPKNDLPAFAEYSFEFAIGTYADPLFFTSPELRKIIDKNPHWKKQIKIGTIDFMRSGDKVMQQHIFPFGELEKEDRKLIRKGIGAGLEKKVLVDFRKRFGDVKLEPSFGLTGPDRTRQLEKRGIRFNPEQIPSHITKLSRMLSAINKVRRRSKRVRQQTRKH